MSAATHQEQVHTTAHYRTLPTGKVTWVHDFHSGHEIANRSREAHLHERTTMHERPNGGATLRATNSTDRVRIQAHARALGIGFMTRRAGANHHGRQGAYDHIDFSSRGDAQRVMNSLVAEHNASHPQGPAAAHVAPAQHTSTPGVSVPIRLAGREAAPPPPAPAQPQAAPAPQEAEAPKEDVDTQFHRIFGERLETPKPDAEAFDQAFTDIFGPISAVEQRHDGSIFGGRPTIQAQPLTLSRAHEIARERVSRKDQHFSFTQGFVDVWNQHCKTDLGIYLDDLFDDFGPGLTLNFSGRGTDIRIAGHSPGKVDNLERSYHLGDKWIYHDYLVVNPSQRGSGFANSFLTKSMDYYKAWGMNYVKVTAALGGGGYAWSRYGFVPESNSSWAQQRVSIKNRFRTFNPTLLAQTFEREAAEAERGGNPGLAASKRKKVRAAQECAQIMADPAKLREFEQYLESPDRWTQWKVSSHPFGQFVMPGTCFHGKFDLTTNKHLNRMLEYVGARAAGRTQA